MTTSNENIDPRSLPNLSNLLTHSARKRNNKRILNRVPSTSPGLKESIQNVEPRHYRMLESGVGLQFPTHPPTSQSVVFSEDKVMEETRLPISPPPEEEIRIKELSIHGITAKEPSSLPVRSRPGVFKVPALPQSSVHSQQQMHGAASTLSSQQSDRTSRITASASTASEPNPRKRSRSMLPSSPTQDGSILMSTDPMSLAQSSTIIPSPNPRARKQPRQHDVAVNSGSGLKRRHKSGTSAGSLDIVDDGPIWSPGSTNLKSPARKKRCEPGIMDYTPERERASTSTSRRSPKKPKRRSTRSSTPEVRYEPPTEQFTPPREVILEIPSSTVSSRSRNIKRSVSTGIESRVERKIVRVKSERLTSPFPLPPLDFSKPVPPPSPTDDPLLLVGPPVTARRSATPVIVPTRTLVDASVGVDEDLCGPSTPVRASPTVTREVDRSAWNFGPDLKDETALMGVAFDGPSTFDATFESEDSNADDDITHDAVHLHPNFESAPVSHDPDQSTGSSAFHSDDENEEVGEDEGEYTGRFMFYTVPVMQDPPSSATRARRESWGRPISPFPFARRLSRPPSIETIPNGPVLLDEDSPPPSPSMGRRRSALLMQKLHAHISPLSPAFSVSPRTPVAPLPSLQANQLTDHSVALGDECSGNTPEFEAANKDDDSLHTTHPISPTRDDDSGSSYYDKHITPAPDDGDGFYTQEFKGSHEDDDGIHGKHIASSPGVVEVSSEDPKAAARAAAILKLHHSYVVDGDATHCSPHPSPSGLLRRPSYTSRDKSIERDRNINVGQVWTKAHWKMLDMCFTDERLALSNDMGLDSQLADVDDIKMNSVVERFLAQIDDEEVDWDYDMLLRRATALKGRQRAGQGAPPSPGGLVFQNTVPEFVVPILTPPTTSRALSLATEAEISKKLPPSLLAPRYAHLHGELTTNSSTPPDLPTLSRSSTSEQNTHSGNDLHEEKDAHDYQATPAKRDESTRHPASPAVQPSGGVPVPPSTAKRLLSYVGSLMGRGSAVASSKPSLRPQFQALPLPPPEMQVTRGPITTPAKKPIPKVQPPRELVRLSETQLPAKPSQFPKAKSAKELVHLNHVEPPRTVQRPRTVSGPIIIPGRSRKDSGGSVKDLVKSFEAVQMKREEEMKRTNSRLGLRKVTSVGNFSARPIWKP